jgi:alkylhydroperoxidase family enzyme
VPLSQVFERLRRQVVDGPGELAADVRHAAYSGGALPDPAAAAYVDKVRRHAYKIVDADVSALVDAGWSEEAIFELTAATALGAAMLRVQRAQQALTEAAG